MMHQLWIFCQCLAVSYLSPSSPFSQDLISLESLLSGKLQISYQIRIMEKTLFDPRRDQNQDLFIQELRGFIQRQGWDEQRMVQILWFIENEFRRYPYYRNMRSLKVPRFMTVLPYPEFYDFVLSISPGSKQLILHLDQHFFKDLMDPKKSVDIDLLKGHLGHELGHIAEKNRWFEFISLGSDELHSYFSEAVAWMGSRNLRIAQVELIADLFNFQFIGRNSYQKYIDFVIPDWELFQKSVLAQSSPSARKNLINKRIFFWVLYSFAFEDDQKIQEEFDKMKLLLEQIDIPFDWVKALFVYYQGYLKHYQLKRHLYQMIDTERDLDLSA